MTQTKVSLQLAALDLKRSKLLWNLNFFFSSFSLEYIFIFTSFRLLMKFPHSSNHFNYNIFRNPVVHNLKKSPIFSRNPNFLNNFCTPDSDITITTTAATVSDQSVEIDLRENRLVFLNHDIIRFLFRLNKDLWNSNNS